MITLEGLVSDLELRFTSAKPSHDFEVPQSQLAQWIDIARDEITRAIIDKDKKIDDSLIMSISSQGEVYYNPTSKKILYDLPYLPLDIAGGESIVSVYTDAGQEFHRISKATVLEMKKMSFTKPSSCIYQYYLENDKLVLLGPNQNNVVNIGLNVAMVIAETNRTKTFTEKYYILPSSVKIILDTAEAIGWRELKDGVYDVTTDGVLNDAN
jgi:hypothetical protein